MKWRFEALINAFLCDSCPHFLFKSLIGFLIRVYSLRSQSAALLFYEEREGRGGGGGFWTDSAEPDVRRQVQTCISTRLKYSAVPHTLFYFHYSVRLSVFIFNPEAKQIKQEFELKMMCLFLYVNALKASKICCNRH